MTSYGPFARMGAIASAGLLLIASSGPNPVSAASSDGRASRHVLLISVDGMHQSDLQQWVQEHRDSTLAHLSQQGTTYNNASTSRPSDSFPGLIAQVTGGTPKSTGVFYDDSYARTLWAPGSTCTGTPGTETNYAENLDRTVQGQIPLIPVNASLQPALNPADAIDPANLPRGMLHGSCAPVYPHSFLQTNTIFNVAHDAGLFSAWSDKHPAYEIVRGPSNTGAEDLFTPEINNANDPTAISVVATEAYDQLKVNAVLNEIDGQGSNFGQRLSSGNGKGVPAIFGMNFQTVSVAQKLVDSYPVPGGYQPGSLTFTPQMEQGMGYVDAAIGAMVGELQSRGLTKSTELIISAKHGQSPINPASLEKIGDPISGILSSAGVDVAQATEDDVALLWLKDQSQTAKAVVALQADKNGKNAARIQEILSGDRLADQFGDPRHDRSTPDIIVQPIKGTIYTGSKTKVAEHGGFSDDDTHVALLVVNGADSGRDSAGATNARVETRQIAPTILEFLGLDPAALQSVRQEGTRPLPGR